MKKVNKSYELIIKSIPIILFIYFIFYLTIFCCIRNKNVDIIELYSNKLSKSLIDQSLKNKCIYNNQAESIKNNSISLLENKSIAVKKINNKDFSVVLF